MKSNFRNLLMLDRDGTLIKHKPYLKDWKEVELLKDVSLVLSELQELGFSFVIITNQSAIGRGLATQNQVNLIHKRLEWLLKKSSVNILEILVCPHSPTSNCECRKPKALLGRIIMEKYGFQKSDTFMIGDQLSDIEFANNLGIAPIFFGEKLDSLVYDGPSFSTWLGVLQYLKTRASTQKL